MGVLIEHMSNEAYHAHSAISKSGLDNINQSPMHFRYFRDHPEPSTEAMEIGSAFHTLLLEPETFKDRVAVWSGAPRNTKAGKEEYAAALQDNPGKLLIKQDQFDEMKTMAQAILAHPGAKAVLDGKGKIEPSLFWVDEETGVECRCRPDWLLDDGLIVDLKTTTDASRGGFTRSAWNFRYHVQAAFYYEGVMRVTGKQPAGFLFIAVEKTAPFAVSTFYADGDMMAAGEMEYRRNLTTYAECLKSGKWPGYPETIEYLSLPAWAIKQIENMENYNA